MLQSHSSHVSHFAVELQSAHSHMYQYYLLLLLLLQCSVKKCCWGFCSLKYLPEHVDLGLLCFVGERRHTDETVKKMQCQTTGRPRSWISRHGSDSSFGIARVRCRWHRSPVVPRVSGLDRQHRIAGSRGRGAIEAQFRQERNQYQSQFWSWMNLVFYYWTWQWKKTSCSWDFQPQDAHCCFTVTVWQNSATE